MLQMECENDDEQNNGMQPKETKQFGTVVIYKMGGGEHIYFNKFLYLLAHAEHHKDSYCHLQETRDRSARRGPSMIHS